MVSDAGGGGGVLPLSGTFLVCLIAKGCGSFLSVPLTEAGTRGMGIGGGVITINGFKATGLRLSIEGNPWTVGTAVVTGIPMDNGGFTFASRKGFVHGPLSETSSTAKPSGVVQLVTPVIVETTLTGSELVAFFGTLRLHFVPEPGTLLLLGSGVAGLAALARRRL